MSRQHTSTMNRQLSSRLLGLALMVLLALGASLPAVTSAQEDRIRDGDVMWKWQLLTYRDANGDVRPAPAGVGATLNLFSTSAFGEAACSSYDTTFARQEETLFIDPPQTTQFDCDPSSQAFDEAFYQNLVETQSIGVSGSILTLFDIIGSPIMTLTRATVDDDPTVARWSLARIADADGSIEPVIQGLDPWIEFLRGGRLVGSTGCGSFLGSYALNDGTMNISDVAYRLDACTESVQQQAERILATLDVVTDFDVLPAGLSLQDRDGTTRLALTPDIDLQRRTWTPIAVYGDDGEVAWGPELLETSAVKFSDDSAAGRSACRAFEADSLRSGLALSVSGTEMIGPKCPKSSDESNPRLFVELERAYIRALGAVSSHALRGSELELKDVEGNTLMRLLPQAELVGPTWVVHRLAYTPNRADPSLKRPIRGTAITADFADLGVVTGDTGADDGSSSNTYDAFYRSPKATRISITQVSVSGRACDGKKRRSKTCRQQARYLQLLQLADGYIVKGSELRLLKGSNAIVVFRPEVIDTGTN